MLKPTAASCCSRPISWSIPASFRALTTTRCASSRQSRRRQSRSGFEHRIGGAAGQIAFGFLRWCRQSQRRNLCHHRGWRHPHLRVYRPTGRVPLTPVHYKAGAGASLIGGHVSPASIHGETLLQAGWCLCRDQCTTLLVSSAGADDEGSGYDVVIEDWLGVLVPSKTPPEIVSKLNVRSRTHSARPILRKNCRRSETKSPIRHLRISQTRSGRISSDGARS